MNCVGYSKMMQNIQRGLGVTTRLDWVTQLPKEQTSETIIITNISGLKKLKITSDTDTTINVSDDVSGTLFIDCITTQDQVQTTKVTINTGKNNQLTIVTRNICKNDLHIAHHTLVVAKDSKVIWFTELEGKKQVLFEQIANLQGSGCQVNTITVSKGNAVYDINTVSDHLAENTTSNILFRSVLTDGKLIARGLVKIRPLAKNSAGYQQSNILLLGNARAVTIPDLEIQNKDVTCSHGSTITKINPEKLFYLQSRGLSKQLAQQVIVKGFITDMYDVLTDDVKEILLGEHYEN